MMPPLVIAASTPCMPKGRNPPWPCPTGPLPVRYWVWNDTSMMAMIARTGIAIFHQTAYLFTSDIQRTPITLMTVNTRRTKNATTYPNGRSTPCALTRWGMYPDA